MRLFARLVVAFLLLATTAHAAEIHFPALTGRVVDDARILDATARQNIDAKLARHEQATGEQVVVVTIPTLADIPIEEYGYKLGRHWGIGQKGKNTGALLVVAPNDRKVRIEVGYGLEDRLTDAASSLIINRMILPRFRERDYNAGISAGVDEMLLQLGGQENARTLTARTSRPAQATAGEHISLGKILLILLILWLVMRRSGGRSIMGPMILGSLLGGRRGGGFGGGGGFSGGGGSFGGGGASGGW